MLYNEVLCSHKPVFKKQKKNEISKWNLLATEREPETDKIIVRKNCTFLWEMDKSIRN